MLLVENENGSSKARKSSVRRKANQRFDGLTPKLAQFVLPCILLDPQCMHSFCEGISKNYQALLLEVGLY